jgi:CubicO group peptidase (beta-lactamase class C family)
MRPLIFLLLLTLPALAQSERLGAFTHSGDVGDPAIKGATSYSNGQYRMTGSGANIWAKQDQFQFVWREMEGNFSVNATLQFLGKGADHRKAGIMVRQSLDTDSAYADVVIHGNGMPGLQWRGRGGENTDAFDFPFDSPGFFHIKLVRTGVRIFMFLAKDGAPMKELAHTEVSFKNPVLVGLVVCSHNAAASDTVVFTDVSVEAHPAPTTGQAYFPPSDRDGGWRTLTSASDIRTIAGMDLERLDRAFEFEKETSQHGGLLVVRHGYLVYEKYFGKGNREAHPDMASIGKAFTSISCGIMLQEKRDLIPDGLETKVFTEKYLPEAFPLDDPSKADIKLGQLLSMTSGMHGDGTNPGIVHGVDQKLEAAPRPAEPLDQDMTALRAPMWTKPGEGYSYASGSPHVASIVLRRLVGMEMQQYIQEKLAAPMGFGPWSYALHRNGTTLPHTPGGGSIALRATDAIRFPYLLLHNGQWGGRQLVPADYISMCAKPSPYNPHSPMSLMFEVNADGHVFGAPRDAYFKSGAGGSAIYIVPSLDLVIYKMAGNDAQFDPTLTGLPVNYDVDRSRDNWKPLPHDQFHDGPVGGDDGVRRLLEAVVAAAIP